MRFIRFLHSQKICFGRLIDNDIQVLSNAPWLEESEPTGTILHLDEVELQSPVLPSDILAIGRNYTEHALENKNPVPKAPIIFIKANSSLTSHNKPIILPHMAPNEVDYEGELAIIIGKRVKNTEQAKALDYVFGYTCANDVSARDCQIKTDVQWARGKSFDTFCPLGPWIETDLDPGNLNIQTTLNGEIVQSSNTCNMIFSCSYLISYLSHVMTLEPGTVILTGTPDGVGVARNPQRFLQPGDKIEVTIQNIGTLSNFVIKDTDF